MRYALREMMFRLNAGLLSRGQSWDEIDTTIIVSTGRTGTQKLASIFSKLIPSSESLHEPYPDLFRLATSYVRGDIHFDAAVKQFARERSVICRRIHAANKRHYIESNNNIAYIIDVAKAEMKRCRFIHVTRDGRDFVRSSYSKTTPTRNGSPALVFSESDPRRRLTALDFPDDPYCDRWESMSRFERICWYWVKTDQRILASLQNDETAIRVRFEDLFDHSRGPDVVHTLCRELGFDLNESDTMISVGKMLQSRENQSSEFSLPIPGEWSDDLKESFNRICGDHMKRLGYPRQNAM